MVWRRIPVATTYDRPKFVTVGLLRLLGLCVVIVAVGMLPGHLSTYEAGWVGWSGLGVLAAVLVVPVLVGVRRLAARLPLADAILRLTNDAPLCARIARAGADDVRQNWLWSRIVEKMQGVYAEVI